MKLFLTFFFFAVYMQLFATNYYVSALGDDQLNTGKSSASPWKTLAKLNTITFVAGDTIFFHCGDIFRGELKLNQGGNKTNKLVLTSYGTGAKPILSGAITNSNWVLADTIYKTTVSDSVGNFFVGNKEQILARYPNEGTYLTLDSAKTTYLKDNQLTTIKNELKSGNICIHTAQWCWEKSKINSVVNDKVNYTTALQLAAMANYGYFFYNNFAALDSDKEWFYNSSTKELFYKPSNQTNPNALNCESSVYKNGITLGLNVANVEILNLSFDKQLEAGIALLNSSNRYILIKNCDFSNQYKHGVNDKGRYNEIANSTFRNIDGIAVYVNGTALKSTIHHNTFRNIGLVRNNGIGTEINGSAIKVAFVDSCHVHHNDIDTVGYCGVAADGGYHLVERNVIKHAMRINNDGAALKSFGKQSHHITFRNNFVSDSDGNTEGTFKGDFLTPGIYFDFEVNNCLVEANTVYNQTQKGIFQNSGNNHNTIRKNIIYRSGYGIDLNGNPLKQTLISDMNIKENVFFALNSNSFLIRQVDYSGGFASGDIDSNYLFHPYNTGNIAVRIEGMTPNAMSLQEWQGTGFDLHSTPSFVNWSASQNESELFINPSDDVLTIDLQGQTYQDLNQNYICGQLTLEPYTSQVLIKAANSCTTAVETIEQDIDLIVFPNPSLNKIYQIQAQEAIKSIQVLDLQGREVYSDDKNSIDKKVDLDLSQLKSGIYYLSIETENNSYLKKVEVL